MADTVYRGYNIGLANYSPAAQFDWEFTHEDYDGAPDGNDKRHGRGASEADCKDQIDDIEDAREERERMWAEEAEDRRRDNPLEPDFRRWGQ